MSVLTAGACAGPGRWGGGAAVERRRRLRRRLLCEGGETSDGDDEADGAWQGVSHWLLSQNLAHRVRRFQHGP